MKRLGPDDRLCCIVFLNIGGRTVQTSEIGWRE